MKSTRLLDLIGDKAPLALYGRSEAARALNWRCYPHTENHGLVWCLSCSSSSSAVFSINDFALVAHAALSRTFCNKTSLHIHSRLHCRHMLTVLGKVRVLSVRPMSRFRLPLLTKTHGVKFIKADLNSLQTIATSTTLPGPCACS